MESLLVQEVETVSHRTRFYLVVLVLAVLTLGAFWPVRNFDFVNYDDDRYLVKNTHLLAGFSKAGLGWVFSADLVYDSPHVDYWQPVTLLSRMLDVQIFGMDSAGHHRMNLIWHILNVLLLFSLLNDLTGSLAKSAVVAGLFAIHPLQVEPVAWVTARKDLLFCFFGLLSIKAYVQLWRKSSWRWGAAALVFFLLSLLSKPMLVTLPFLLILLDYWPLGQIKLKAFKIGLLAFSVLFSILPFIGQSNAYTRTSLASIFLNLPIRYVAYLKRMILPTGLGVYTPIFENPPLWQAGAAVILLLGLSALALSQIKKRPFLAFGWFWYLIALLPTVMSERFEDRFLYFPMIGLLTAGVWGVRLKKFTPVLAIAVFFYLTPLTFAQATHWKDSIRLFTHSLSVSKNHFLAHNQLCAAWLDRREFEKAKAHCAKALQIRSGLPEVHYNLGLAFAGEKNWEEAARQYESALEARPHYFQAHNNLAAVLMRLKKTDAAIFHFKEAVRLNPVSAEGQNNLGAALVQTGQWQEAIGHYQEAVRLKPDYFAARYNLRAALSHERQRKAVS